MLSCIRNTSNNIVFKILLLCIILSFIFWGVQDALKDTFSKKPETIVKFKNGDPITVQDIHDYQVILNFLKKDQILNSKAAKENILNAIINNHLMTMVAKNYDFSPSNKAALQYFSDNINHDVTYDNLKAYIHALQKYIPYNQEKIFNLFIKNNVVQDVVEKIFNENYYVPNLMKENLANYLSQDVTAYMMTINLSDTNLSAFASPTEKELEEFYQEHQKEFLVPETRDILYIKLDPDNQNIKIDNHILKDFFDKNRHNFPENYEYIKNQADIKSQYIEWVINSLTEKVLDPMEYRTGSEGSLVGVLKSLGLHPSIIKDSKITKLKERKDLAAYAESMFKSPAMQMLLYQENTTQELQNKSILIAEIQKIKACYLPALTQVKEQVLEKWLAHTTKIKNLEFVYKLRSNLNKTNFLQLAKEYGLQVQTVSSSDKNPIIKENINLFDSDLGKISPVSIDYSIDKAFIAMVIEKKMNLKRKNELLSDLKISNPLQDSLMEELLLYLYNDKDIKILNSLSPNRRT